MKHKNKARLRPELRKPHRFAALIAAVFCGAANAEPSLILVGDESNLMQDLSDGLGRSDLSTDWSVTPNADVTDALAGSSGEIVVLQKLEVPDITAMNETLRMLDERGERATYMVFVEYADDFQWVGELATPNNVKLATTVRSQDQRAVAEVYQSVGLNYDGAGVGYDYAKAAEMALRQLDASSGDVASFALQDWEPGVSSMFFDAPIMLSGAPSEVAAEFVSTFDSNRGGAHVPWENAFGVKQIPQFDAAQMGEWNALMAEIVLGECSGSERWDGLIEQAVSFQSFGIDLKQ